MTASLRAAMDHYVRSLKERADDPESQQDLGTFLCWLLVRRGYDLHRVPYLHRGTSISRRSGYLEWGVDIIASRPDEEGRRSHCFVLKRGDVTREGSNPGVQGSLLSDMWEAVRRNIETDNWFRPSQPFESRTVVAVHNGDIAEESIGQQIGTDLHSMRERYGVEVDWWKASDLVDMALQSPASHDEPSLLAHSDVGLFPPGSRSFATLALASFRKGSDGTSFDLRAVDLLLDSSLPLDESEALSAAHVVLRSSEVALFASMVEVDAETHARSSVLPVLDTLDRVLPRVMELGRRIERWDGHRQKFVAVVDLLIRQYVDAAQRLSDRLNPVLDVDSGLALAASSEAVDYPLRCYRFVGYFATAVHMARDLGDASVAGSLSSSLARLIARNPGGALMPVLDDQIIEVAAVLSALDEDAALGFARGLAERFLLRCLIGRPLPAMYQRARLPMDSSHLHAIVETYQNDQRAIDFDDRASTVLPLVLYFLFVRGEPLDDEYLVKLKVKWFDGGGLKDRALSLQEWQPPSDAADEWYRKEIADRGATAVLDTTSGMSEVVAAFVRFAGAMPESFARNLERESLDWVAWRTFRTPPPMALMIALGERTSQEQTR